MPNDQTISIHALREEGDRLPWLYVSRTQVFLSTPSARRATPAAGRRRYYLANFYPRPPRGGRRDSATYDLKVIEISIHALREEGDMLVRVKAVGVVQFLSTPSARRATDAKLDKQQAVTISIHALREEGDQAGAVTSASVFGNFYPRPPRGGRQQRFTA